MKLAQVWRLVQTWMFIVLVIIPLGLLTLTLAGLAVWIFGTILVALWNR